MRFSKVIAAGGVSLLAFGLVGCSVEQATDKEVSPAGSEENIVELETVDASYAVVDSMNELLKEATGVDWVNQFDPQLQICNNDEGLSQIVSQSNGALKGSVDDVVGAAKTIFEENDLEVLELYVSGTSGNGDYLVEVSAQNGNGSFYNVVASEDGSVMISGNGDCLDGEKLVGWTPDGVEIPGQNVEEGTGLLEDNLE